MISDIEVDTWAKNLAGHPGEKITEGLDGLRVRHSADRAWRGGGGNRATFTSRRFQRGDNYILVTDDAETYAARSVTGW